MPTCLQAAVMLLVSASFSTKASWRSVVQPSCRRRTGTGSNGTRDLCSDIAPPGVKRRRASYLKGAAVGQLSLMSVLGGKWTLARKYLPCPISLCARQQTPTRKNATREKSGHASEDKEVGPSRADGLIHMPFQGRLERRHAWGVPRNRQPIAHHCVRGDADALKLIQRP